MKFENPEISSLPQLTRQLGRMSAMLLTAAMIIGTGLFAALGPTAEKAGSGVIISILFGGIVILLTGFSAIQLGTVFPEEGGGFIWSRKIGHPTLGFVAGCAYLGKGIMSLVTISLAFAKYCGISGVSVNWIAFIALLSVTGLNYFGIKTSAKVMIGFLFIQLFLLAIFVILALPHFKINNFGFPWEKGAVGILSGAAVFFWSWDGFMRTAIMASEIKDPEKNIPFAVVGGIALSGIVFVIITGIVLGVIGPHAMSHDTPLLIAGRQVGTSGIFIILITAWLVALTEAAGDLLAATRVLFAMGKVREFPGWLGAVHKKFKSPHHAILLLGPACAFLALFAGLRHVLYIANAFTLIWYSIVHWDAIQLKEKRRVPRIVSWMGILGCAALFLYLPVWSPLIAVCLLFLALGIRRLHNAFPLHLSY